MTRKNFIDHLHSGIGRSPLQMVMINGRVVYRSGVFPHLDEARIRARSRETARSLWERM
jgi:hypothetical protein